MSHDGDTFVCWCGDRVDRGNYQRHYVCVDAAVRQLGRQIDEVRLMMRRAGYQLPDAGPAA